MPSHIIQLHCTFLYVLSRIKRYAESHYTAPPMYYVKRYAESHYALCMYYLGLNGMPSHIIQLHCTFLYVYVSRIKRYAESHYTAPPYVAALCII